MNDNQPEAARGPQPTPENEEAQTLTLPAIEQDQRVEQVRRDAKQSGAGANDEAEAVNPDG